MDKRAVALVSGGLDSVVSLAKAAEEMAIRLVVFVDYRQKALDRERQAVLGICDYYAFPLKEINARWLGDLSPEAMRYAAGGATGDAASQARLDTVDAVWIPNRNGVFLNLAAAFAESYGCQYVVTGFNREEAAEFPDNSAEYVCRANRALEFSTRNGVEVVSFTQGLRKPDIIRLGQELRAPLSVIWSCYHGGERMCGRCASCARLKTALATLRDDERPPLEFET